MKKTKNIITIAALAELNKLSRILLAPGASFHVKGRIYRACVHDISTYGTETWAMKAKNLQSLKRTE